MMNKCSECKRTLKCTCSEFCAYEDFERAHYRRPCCRKSADEVRRSGGFKDGVCPTSRSDRAADLAFFASLRGGHDEE